MASEYFVYPVYGKDKLRRQIIIGNSKVIDDIKLFRQCISMSCRTIKIITPDFIIVDWKHYRIKEYFNRHEYPWKYFKSESFYRDYRFTSPCEDWEIKSKGYVVDAVRL
jgi:hypothetical protein